MKNFNKNNYIFILMLGVLVGCGGESSSSNKRDEDNSPARWNQITSQDINYKILLEVASTIDLANYTQAINSGAEYALTSFEQINERTSCSEYQMKDTKIVFEMSLAQECYYEYTMQDVKSGSTSNAILRVAASSEYIDQSVRQFSAVTQIGDVVPIRVNDGATVPEGYFVDGDSIQVLGHGNARVNELDPNEIYYFADTEESSQGIHRILFSYIHEENQSIIQGLIDVVVGRSSKNFSPKAVNFRFGDFSSFNPGEQLDYKYVAAGQEIEINIAPYFSQGLVDAYGKPIELTDNNGNAIFDEQGNQIHFYLKPDKVTSTPVYTPGNYLIDQDKDILQLTDVFAYDSFVKVVEDDSFTGTSFLFKSNREGYHYVTYVLSDHNNGYGVGIVEIRVGDNNPEDINKPWDAVFITESNGIFMAPIIKEEADNMHLPYLYSSDENGLTGPSGWGTPLFDYDTASMICSIKNMRLPKEEELANLIVKYPDGLYKSLDSANEDIDKRKQSVNWPTAISYWTLANKGNSSTSVVNLFDYTVNPQINIYDSLSYYAVVCISPGLIESMIIVDNDAKRLPFGEYNKVQVTIKDYSGQPIIGERVAIKLANGMVMNEKKSNPVTNSNGIAEFFIGSRMEIKNGILESKFYNHKETVNNFNITRIPPYMRQTLNDVCFYNELDTMVSNKNCTNSTNIYKNIRYGNVGQTIFYDNKYVYRLYGNRLRVYDDIINASGFTNNYRSEHIIKDLDEDVSILYDGKYYWISSKRNGNAALEAYLTIGDMLNNNNIKHRITITDKTGTDNPLYSAFIYYPNFDGAPAYARTASKTKTFRIFRNIEDAVGADRNEDTVKTYNFNYQLNGGGAWFSEKFLYFY
ncbi:Ig-like domain-containing protein [Vibrio metschnikovii]|nr:Ig-like domain-containing protein [Vibrio metschnikovii]